MSYSFNIEGVEKLEFERVTGLVGDERLTFEGADRLEKPDQWPNGYLHLYLDGVSCRPVETCLEKNVFPVRVLSASSPEDVRLGLRLAKAVSTLTDCPVTTEDRDEPMSAEDFRARFTDEWAWNHARESILFVRTIFEDEGSEMTFSGIKRDFVLGPRIMAALPTDPDEFVVDFIQRFRRLQYIEYENVFVSSVLVIASETKENEVARTSVLSDGVATVLPRQGDLVSLPVPDGDVRHLRFESLVEILGNRLEWLSEDMVLVPALDEAEYTELVEKAAPHFVELDDCFVPDETPVLTNGPLTDEELGLIQYGPLLVFLAVAVVDGKVDQRAVKAFGAALAQSIRTAGEPLQSAIAYSLANVTTMFDEIVKERRDVLGALKKLNQVLDDRLKIETALAYKKGLLGIAEKVARSLKSLLKLGRNARNRKVLKALRRLFGLEIPK